MFYLLMDEKGTVGTLVSVGKLRLPMGESLVSDNQKVPYELDELI
jgi:hypothetical protein